MPLVIQNKAERQRDTSLEPVFKKHLIAIRASICVVRTVNTVWPIRAGIRLTGRQKHNSEAWEEAPTSTKNSKDGCWTGREAKSSDVLEMGVEPEQELPLTHAQCLWSHSHRHIYKSPEPCTSEAMRCLHITQNESCETSKSVSLLNWKITTALTGETTVMVTNRYPDLRWRHHTTRLRWRWRHTTRNREETERSFTPTPKNYLPQTQFGIFVLMFSS